jgi:uncharacterized protein YbaR (Trm112 family)
MSAIDSWLREILRCPSCHSALRDVTGPGGGPELACTGCSLAYRIDDGIPVLLVEEARDRDTDTSLSGAPTGDQSPGRAADQSVGQSSAGPEQSGL